MNPKITHAEPLEGNRLYINFANGETRIFDVSPYLDKGVFTELRDPDYFKRVRVIAGGVEWPNEQDLSADTLYIRGIREL